MKVKKRKISKKQLRELEKVMEEVKPIINQAVNDMFHYGEAIVPAYFKFKNEELFVVKPIKG